jgi:hypothetical protein
LVLYLGEPLRWGIPTPTSEPSMVTRNRILLLLLSPAS